MTGPAARPPHVELADLHTYIVAVSPKMLLETLNVANAALNALEQARPGFNAGGSVATHQARLQLLAQECSEMRPVGTDGKHGNLHTPVCGCDRGTLDRFYGRTR